MAELPTRRAGDAARASARARVEAAARRRDQLASLREEKFKRIAAESTTSTSERDVPPPAGRPSVGGGAGAGFEPGEAAKAIPMYTAENYPTEWEVFEAGPSPMYKHFSQTDCPFSAQL